MNSRRLVLAFCVALTCSSLLTCLLSRRLTRYTRISSPAQSRSIVIAAKRIPAGEPLTTSSISTVGVTAFKPLPGFVGDMQGALGRVALVSISPGEPVLSHDLGALDTKASMGLEIPDGMRAVSISGSEQIMTGAALLIPGSRVDILVSYRSEATNTFVSSLVLEDVLVAACNHKTFTEAATQLLPSGVIILLVTPSEAARLAVASSLGKLVVALRNQEDRALHPELTQTTLDLATKQARTTPLVRFPLRAGNAPVRDVKGFVVETLAGGKSSIQTFSEGQE